MKERLFLVQRIVDIDTEDEYRTSTLMTPDELIHYIDMQDYCSESYDIYDVTEFGKVVHIHYINSNSPGAIAHSYMGDIYEEAAYEYMNKICQE